MPGGWQSPLTLPPAIPRGGTRDSAFYQASQAALLLSWGGTPPGWRCGCGTESGGAQKASPGARAHCYSPLSLPLAVHSFHWTRNSRFFNIAKDPRVSMKRRSGTLVIDFRSGGRPEEYEGEYQCFARNKFGTALSNRIRLQVSSE